MYNLHFELRYHLHYIGETLLLMWLDIQHPDIEKQQAIVLRPVWLAGMHLYLPISQQKDKTRGVMQIPAVKIKNNLNSQITDQI